MLVGGVRGVPLNGQAACGHIIRCWASEQRWLVGLAVLDHEVTVYDAECAFAVKIDHSDLVPSVVDHLDDRVEREATEATRLLLSFALFVGQLRLFDFDCHLGTSSVIYSGRG